jgi:hypothetical protein
MKYQIIEASSSSELEKNVRLMIADGYEPQGGMAVEVFIKPINGTDSRFYQAMIKESK